MKKINLRMKRKIGLKKDLENFISENSLIQFFAGDGRVSFSTSVGRRSGKTSAMYMEVKALSNQGQERLSA